MRRMATSLVVLCALVALVAAPQARAGDGTHDRPHVVHGVIVHVDLEHSAIVLHTRERNLHIHVHDNTRISLNGEPAELADLQQGDRARVGVVQDRHHHDRFRLAATSIAARRLR